MMIRYSLFELLLYLFLYAFLAWVAEVCWYSFQARRFVNQGFIDLPFNLPYGIAMALLIQILPTLEGRLALQFVAVLVVLAVTRSLANAFTHRVSRMAHWETGVSAGVPDSARGWVTALIDAAITLGVYALVHPMLASVVLLLPKLVTRLGVLAALLLLAADYLAVRHAVRHGAPAPATKSSQRLADQIDRHIWERLQRAYPGVATDPEAERDYTFAKGICWDKLVWVFLICALLGDIIETFYCGLVDGEWMNRSSVLYGPFSFVWGIGAVVLTVSLQRLKDKSDRWVFAGGFVIGGAYEYMCSVFTELVFGTVFWDYSDMPLNIGGRTNVLFCFFWGLLALVWVKTIYPPIDRVIEKTPPIAGKIATWVVVLAMVCNGLLTGAAMMRYNTRAVRPEPSNIVEEFLDSRYGDGYIEHRWPNMIVTGESGET